MWPISIATERTRRVHRAKTNLSVNRVMDATLHGPLCLSNKRGLRPRPALDTLASRVLRWGVLGAVIILSLVGLYDVGVVSFVSPASAITTGWRWLSVVIDVERSRASMWALLVLAPLAQSVFVAGVALLVARVPAPVPIPLVEAGGDLRPSMLGVYLTVIHFANETPTPVKLK